MFFSKKRFNRKYFLVTSHGNTGTLWLAANLNQHSEVFCTHNYNYPIIEPLQKLALKKSGVKMQVEKSFWELSIAEFFKQHDETTPKRIIGNVHAYTLGHVWGMLPRLLSPWSRRRLAVMNMARHPVSRISSCFHTWDKGDDDPGFINKPNFINKDFNTKCNHILHFLEQKNYKIDGMRYSVRCFIVALLQSEHVAVDIALAHKKQVGNIIFEKMISGDTDYYNGIFRRLTGLAAYESNAGFGGEEIKHQHNPKKALTPKDNFEQWEDWQKEAFRFVVERNEMRKIYSACEYDLSFV